MSDQYNNQSTMAERMRRKIAENPAGVNESKTGSEKLIADQFEVGLQIGTDEFTTTHSGKDVLMDRDVNLRLLKIEFVGNKEAEAKFSLDVLNQIKGLGASEFGVPFDMGKCSNGVMYAALYSKKSVYSHEEVSSIESLGDSIREKISKNRKSDAE
jgi:hypothetical protein